MVRCVSRTSADCKMGFLRKSPWEDQHLERFLFHVEEDMQFWTKELWKKKKMVWMLSMNKHADCEGRPVFEGLLQVRDLKKKKSSECVSPLVTVSCCSDARFSPAETAAGPLSLGSSFAPRTYRHTETVAEIMVKEIKHMQTSTWQKRRWQTLGLALFLVSVWV